MVEPSPPAVAAPTGSALGRLPARAVLVVLAVEVVALVLVLASVSTPTTGEATLAAFLTLLSLVHTELATGVERARRQAAGASYFDLSSVWTFAAALLLPPMLAAAVIAVVYSHLWWRVWRPAGVPLYRHVYTTATVVLAAAAAHAVVQGAGGMPTEAGDVGGMAGIGLAVLLYVAVNTLLVAGAIALSERRRAGDRAGARDLIGRWDDNALELATICMGALAAVAAELQAGSRAQDVVGRFGGEEFVVLLRHLPPGPEATTVLHAVAERIRLRVFELTVPVTRSAGAVRVSGLSVSVGGAVLPSRSRTPRCTRPSTTAATGCGSLPACWCRRPGSRCRDARPRAAVRGRP